MIVCHCHCITDRTVRTLCRQGARSLRDVEFGCGAGTECGGCREALAEIIDSERNSPEPRGTFVPLEALQASG